MARGKYNRDYRLNEYFAENGRVRTDYEYIGPPCYFCADYSEVQKQMNRGLALTVLAAAAFVIGLIPYSGMMHRLWIALPYVVTAVPVFMMGDLMLSMRKWKEPMERRNAEKLNNSFPARSLAIAWFSLAALAGECVYLAMEGFAFTGDSVMLVCTAAVFWSALMLFRMRASLRSDISGT